MSSLSKLEAAGIHILSALEEQVTPLAEITGVQWPISHGYTARQCLSIILDNWEDGKGTRPPTWRSFMEVLRELNLEVLGEEIAQYLSGTYVS